MLHYQDKRANTTETKTMTVEEFIGALTRQIHNHHFRTIRRYGIYSRRLKSLMKKIIQHYQSQVKKLIVAVTDALKPKKWAERIAEEFGENPMECSRCGETYEVLGISVRKKGRLVVKYAKNSQATRFMREENWKIEQKEFQYEYEKEKAEAFRKFDSIGHTKVRFICLECGVKENIPKSVVDLFEEMDLEYIPDQPPQFSCKKCDGEMYPEYYKNAFGYEFRISDR